MWRTVGVPVLAGLGLLLAGGMIYHGQRATPVATIPFKPAQSPYTNYIACQGLIETIDRDVSLSVTFPELVMEVYRHAGDQVKKGDPLFKVDTRRVEAELQAAQEAAQVAESELANARNRFSYFERLQDRAAVSEQEFAAASYTLQIAQNKYQEAQAQVEVLKTQIVRSTTYAPFDGQILQVNTRGGEFGNVNPFDRLPLMLFGDTSAFHLRLSIDEEDAWRFKKGARATAFVRSNATIEIPLEFVSVDPYMAPKRVLTGSTVERVDTRVLEAVYRFERDSFPVYVGQLLDVFVEADPMEPT